MAPAGHYEPTLRPGVHLAWYPPGNTNVHIRVTPIGVRERRYQRSCWSGEREMGSLRRPREGRQVGGWTGYLLGRRPGKKLAAIPRCLVLQHLELESTNAIGETLDDADIAIEQCSIFADDSLPVSLDGFDGLVVMGGLMSAMGDEGFPTRRQERYGAEGRGRSISRSGGSKTQTFDGSTRNVDSAGGGSRTMSRSSSTTNGWPPMRPVMRCKKPYSASTSTSTSAGGRWRSTIGTPGLVGSTGARVGGVVKRA
jgi:hypothetical protein